MELLEVIQSGVLQDIKDAIAERTIPLALDSQGLDYAALNTAIQCGHSIIAEYLLSIGCRVNVEEESDGPENTPLHSAVILEDIDLIEKLLEKDANILAVNDEGNSSLHIAFLIRNERIVDLLLDTLQRKNYFTNVKNGHGLSHMHIACTRKHSKVVESFVESRVDLNDCVDEDSFLWSGYSALHFAVEFRSINAVKAILNSRVFASLSIEDAIQNLTPLGFAQQQMEDLSVITDLLSNKKSEKSDCVIVEQREIKKVEEVTEIKEMEDVKQIKGMEEVNEINEMEDVKPIKEMEDVKHIKEMKEVKEVKEMEEVKEVKEMEEVKQIEKMEEVKEIKEEVPQEKIVLAEMSTTGLSSFHVACMENNPDLVEYLLANGASIHQPVISHIDLFHLYTPLHLAVEAKCKRTVEILLKHGADVNLQNNDRMTPLHLSLYINDHDDKQAIVDYLYAAVQCKLANPKDANGLSYLHIACTRNDVKTVTYLLDIGEDVDAQVQRNSRNVPNFTPMHFAVEYRHADIARLLIAREANINRYSLRGTPLHLACEYGDVALVGLLLDSGAKVDETMTLHSLVEAYADKKDGKLLEHVEKLVRLGVDVDAKDARGNTALHVFCGSKKFDENDGCIRFLLDLGANVNLENNEGKTAFELGGDLAVFYHHVQELKALGVEVNPKNDERCWRMLGAKFVDEETLERKRQQRIDEITCMKSIKLGKHVALDDFLRMDRDHAAVYAGNEILRLVVRTYDLVKFFPTYAYLVKLQYCRAVGGFGVRKKREVDWERMAKRPRV